ncbi:MAG: NAD(P)(+) transhydrogenase (Re/Si-specific) subunit alpha, partial [Kiritimatiellae bacterium]|nr:NAD(P)(+) transhydrogenase (Re/Si-specific) subunit alpha [Kiritimatiellia bacterium]
FADGDYAAAGAHVATGPDAAAAKAWADVVLRVGKPSSPEGIKKDALHVSFLDPFRERPLVDAFAAAGIRLVSLEMIPRTTLAQKMDAQSSQTSLAGYAAVLAAAARLPKALPMMVTPAGTITPARVFVIGVGVAGLQAIATAKRLGARVDAFDTRPAVEEQVKSLGATFVKIDLGGETGQTAQGYARELTPEQLARQREGQAKVCEKSDIVITTAKVFGRPAPRLLGADVLARMKPGSVVVDMAAATGGNVEGSKPFDEVVTEHGVVLLPGEALERRVPQDASKMLSGNFTAFLEHFRDRENGGFREDLSDEIYAGCLITRGGAVVHPRFAAKPAGA